MNGNAVAILVITIVFLVIAFVTVCLRSYVRRRLIRAFGWDDGFMVAAMVFYVTQCIVTILGAAWGFGESKEYFLDKPDNLRRSKLLWWLGQIFYALACVVAKLSLASTLLRVTFDRIYSVILYAVMALTTIAGLLIFFATIFTCNPPHLYWDADRTPDKCRPMNPGVDIVYFYSAVAAVTDLTIGILPFFLIWRLRMRWRSKVAIAGILGFGCICDRPYTVLAPCKPSELFLFVAPPTMWFRTLADYVNMDDTTPICICSIIEPSLLIAAGSLTTLRPLLRIFHGRSREPTPTVGHQELPSTTKSPYRNSGRNHLRDDISVGIQDADHDEDDVDSTPCDENKLQSDEESGVPPSAPPVYSNEPT